MEFADLYGTELDRRLGSDDQANLFTTVRRKAAINAAQEWFILKTGCLWKTGLIVLRNGIGEYDLEVELPDEEYIGLAAQLPDIQIVPATGPTRYVAGEDFARRTEDWLDQDDPSWRTADDGTPTNWYEKSEAAQSLFGVTPAPLITVGDVWTLRVRHIVQADEMTADDDEPFTLDGTTKFSMRPFQDALGDYAAYQLEQLRKDMERSATFLGLAERRAKDYTDAQRTPGGGVIQTQKRYFNRNTDLQPDGSRFGRVFL